MDGRILFKGARMYRATVFAFVVVPVMALSSVLFAQQKLLEVPVSPVFSESELAWEGSMGKITVAWAVLDISGVAHVCGATSASTSFAHRNTRGAFRKAWIKLEGRKILKDLSFFTRTPRNSDLSKVKAGCKALPGGSGQGTRFQLGFDPVRVRM